MSITNQDQIQVLRAQVTFLGRQVRNQDKAIAVILTSIDRLAEANAASMRHVILALQAASCLARGQSDRRIDERDSRPRRCPAGR